MTDLEDRALLARCLAGEAGAWEDFVRRFTPYLASVCRRALSRGGLPHGPAEVEDAVQQAFVSLLEADRRSLRGYSGRSSLAGYLSVVAVRQVADGRVLPVLDGDSPVPAATEAHPAEARERAAILRREWEALPSRFHLALRLQSDGASLKEVGLALGISEVAAAQTVHRAREALRARLESLGLGKS